VLILLGRTTALRRTKPVSYVSETRPAAEIKSDHLRDGALNYAYFGEFGQAYRETDPTQAARQAVVALLLLSFRPNTRSSWQLQHGRALTVTQPGEQHSLPSHGARSAWRC
jgi:hypothetical protein